MHLIKTFFAAIVAAIAFASTASTGFAADCTTTLSHLKMGDNGFEQAGSIGVQPNGLVCNAEYLHLQDRVADMQQQRGWFGTEWTEGDVRHRLVNPSATRWTQEVPGFFGPDKGGGTTYLNGWGV